MRELFVYYRVRSAQAGAAHRAALAFQGELRSRHPALMARLLRRDENTVQGIDSDSNIANANATATASEQTWMETYAIDPRTDAAGVSQALQAEIEAGGRALATFIHGTRHTEVFIACASP